MWCSDSINSQCQCSYTLFYSIQGMQHIFTIYCMVVQHIYTVSCSQHVTIIHECGRADLLDVQLLWMCSSILHQLIAVPGENVKLGNDAKERTPCSFGSGHIGVQLVLAPQVPSPREMICLHLHTTGRQNLSQVPGKCFDCSWMQKQFVTHKGFLLYCLLCIVVCVRMSQW